MKAARIAIRNEEQHAVIFADNTHCTFEGQELIIIPSVIGAIILALVAFRIGYHCQKKKKRGYHQVPLDGDSEERSRFCMVSKVIKKSGKAAKSSKANEPVEA